MTVLVLLACAMAFTLAAWVNAHTYMTEFGDAKVREGYPPRQDLPLSRADKHAYSPRS